MKIINPRCFNEAECRAGAHAFAQRFILNCGCSARVEESGSFDAWNWCCIVEWTWVSRGIGCIWAWVENVRRVQQARPSVTFSWPPICGLIHVFQDSGHVFCFGDPWYVMLYVFHCFSMSECLNTTIKITISVFVKWKMAIVWQTGKFGIQKTTLMRRLCRGHPKVC